METTPDEQIRYWLHCLESACKLADDAGKPWFLLAWFSDTLAAHAVKDVVSLNGGVSW